MIFYSNHLFDLQILAFQRSGLKLGTFKSINESITRVAVYISLLALYALGGSKVKTVRYACILDFLIALLVEIKLLAH